MTTLKRWAGAFRSNRSSQFFYTVWLKTFVSRGSRWFRRWVWTAWSAWRAIARVAAITSFSSSISIFTSSTVSTGNLSGPRIAPFISLFYYNFTCRTNWSSFVQVVIFVMRHSMRWQFTEAGSSTVEIFFKWSRSASCILWWWAIVISRTFSWNSFKWWSSLKAKYLCQQKLDKANYPLTLIDTMGTGLKWKVFYEMTDLREMKRKSYLWRSTDVIRIFLNLIRRTW